MAASENLVQAVGHSAWLTIVVGLLGALAGGWRSRLGDLQLARDPDVVRSIVQGDERRRARMERQLLFDYGFLLAYWLMFVGLAVIVARRPGAEYEAAALGAALAATATALLDVLENVRTRGLLALSRPGDQVRRQPVEHLRQTSLAKWFASAVTLAVLAVGFLTAESGQRFPGLAFLAVAVLGFCAIALDRLIPVYLAALFVLGVALAVWFTFDSAGAVAHL